jgi:hypothetical protein
MIRIAFFFILVMLGSSVYAQFKVTIRWQQIKEGNEGDTIYYDPGRKLVWSDFKGRPDASSPAAAITESGFGYKMTMQSYNHKTNVVITVYCYFNKKKSWVKNNIDADYALLHEQHHYDITYINTCLFIKKLKEAQFNLGNYNYLVDKIHDESFEALDKMQDDYDGQTSNGRIKHRQTAWNRKIDRQLAELIIN